ncbi:hypothetical protein NIES208_17715 [[Limnothrix rosea] IAM M-220]|nr:hypothetical protein NIES208_17715 [[Limnothrix rosea] IAM M-220]
MLDGFWQIVWQNESLFHLSILFTFLVALSLEIWITIQYWQSLNQEVRVLKIINQNPNNPRLNSKQRELAGDYLEKQGTQQYRLKQNLQSLLKVSPSQLRFATTVCTAIGVLGTFYGIQKSLQGIDFSNITSDDLLSQVQDIVSGMGTAFSTSLFGLGCSSILTITLAIAEFSRRFIQKSNKRKILPILDRLIIQEQNENLILDKFDRLVDQLEKNGSAQTTQALEQIARRLNPQAIGQAVGQSINAELTPVFSKIEENNKSLLLINQSQKETLDNLIQNMRRELIEPVTEELRRSAELTEQASTAIMLLNKELGEITINLGKSVETIRDFQQGTLVELKTFADSLKGTLEEFRTETTKTIDYALKESIDCLKIQQEEFKKSSEESDRLLKNTTRRAIKLMDNAGKNLQASLANIDESLDKMRITAQKELESFRVAYQEELVAFLDSQNQLLEGTLGKQRDALKEVVESLKSAFEAEIKQREALVNDLESTMKIVKEGVESIGKSYEDTHEKVVTIHKFSAQLNSNFDQRILQLNELSDYVGKAAKEQSERYQKHIEASEQWQKKFFDSADSALSAICGDLLGAAELLLNAENTANGNN